MINEKTEHEFSERAQVHNFFQSFQGLRLVNSEGQEITLRIKQIPDPELDATQPSDQFWLLEFEGFPGFDAFAYTTEGNYVEFAVDFEKKRITAQYALLKNPALKGKNIFSQIRRHIGHNFPSGFEYFVEVAHTQTADQLLGIRKQVVDGQMNEAQACELIKASYKIQERIKSGFNIIHVQYEASEIADITAKKNSELTEPEITVDFDL